MSHALERHASNDEIAVPYELQIVPRHPFMCVAGKFGDFRVSALKVARFLFPMIVS